MIHLPCHKKLTEVLNNEWFATYSLREPKKAHEFYTARLARVVDPEEKNWKAYSILMQAVTGVSTTSANDYMHWTFGDRNQENHSIKEEKKKMRPKLGEEKARILDLLFMELGCNIPKKRIRNIKGGTNRIAILTEFSQVPSKEYHIALFETIQKEAYKSHLTVSINEIQEGRYGHTILELIWNSCPDGIIIIRKTPTEKALKYIEHIGIPTVIINGQRRIYPSPIVSNIVSVLDHPDKNPYLKNDLKKWLQCIPNLGLGRKVVIAHMPRTDSHRENRVRFLEQVLKEEGYESESYLVDNYQAAQAKYLLNAHLTAPAYLCLADTIAVSLKHLLEVKGEMTKNRILGFDDSELALSENVSSFGQNLRATEKGPSLGALAIQKLLEAIHSNKGLKSFQNIEVPVYLALRD